MKFSKNKKLDYVLNNIYNDLQDLGVDEIKRYMKEFRFESDYNLAQYGNMLIYFQDVRDLYKKAGYKTLERFSDDKIWEIYKRQTGYVARLMTR